MKRTTKRYVVTTSALNCYSFRVLTEGGDLSQYTNNPIMLWMHIRATGNTEDQILALGRCVDLKTEGDSITCFLEFDENDPFAMRIYNKYENGTYNMLSLGAKPIEISDDPELKLPGQTGPTVTKWLYLETSCVDIGGNPEAHGGQIQLYDADDKKVEMANLTGDSMLQLFNPAQKTQIQNSNMKLINLTGPALSGILLALKLQETATEVEVQKAVSDAVQLSLSQATTIQTLTSAKETAEASLAEKVELSEKEGIKTMVEGYVGKKILLGQVANYITLASANKEATKAALDALPNMKGVKEQISEGKKTTTDYVALSWKQLEEKNMLVKLKAENFELFTDKFKEHFGKDYKVA